MPRQDTQNLFETTLRLLRRGGALHVKKIFQKLHSTDAAKVIAQFDSVHQDEILALIHDLSQLPQIFIELGSTFLGDYLKRQNDTKKFSDILRKIPSGDRADLLRELPDKMAEEILKTLPHDESEEVSDLLQYQETTAGGLMTPEVFELKESMTVGDAIGALQKETQAATIFYIYVVDDMNKLVGVLSIRQLFQVDHKKMLKEIMLRDVVKVLVDEPQKEVARIVAQYDLVALPVIDSEGKLVVVITVDDIIDVINEEAHEKMLMMNSVEAIDETSFFTSLKKRIPWFLLLLSGTILTCEVIVHFYSFLPGFGVFAGFIPMILRFSGIIARQTSALMVQLESYSVSSLFKIIKEQGGLVLAVALMTSLLTMVYAYYRFQGFPSFPIAVGIALFSSMIFSFALGVAVPFIFRKIRLDAALSPGFLNGFLLDVLGLYFYFKVLVALVSR